MQRKHDIGVVLSIFLAFISLSAIILLSPRIPSFTIIEKVSFEYVKTPLGLIPETYYTIEVEGKLGLGVYRGLGNATNCIKEGNFWRMVDLKKESHDRLGYSQELLMVYIVFTSLSLVFLTTFLSLKFHFKDSSVYLNGYSQKDYPL